MQMNTLTMLTFSFRRACLAMAVAVSLTSPPAKGADVEQLTEGRLIEATSAVLNESGICLEARRDSSQVGLKIRIPVMSPVGKTTDFYMRARQGSGGRETTTSMLLSEYEGKWAPPVYVTLWDLSHPASEVRMSVGFVNQRSGVTTRIVFTNSDLTDLFGFEEGDGGEDDFDKVLRAGCQRWDLENPKDKKP